MYCPKCGAESPEGASFCHSCGQPLNQAATSGAPPAQTSQPTNQPMSPGSAPHIPSHLGWAIVSILLFWPTGIPAVVYASRVDSLAMMGDTAGAQAASGKAKTFATISTVLFVIWLVIVIIAVAVTGSNPVY